MKNTSYNFRRQKISAGAWTIAFAWLAVAIVPFIIMVVTGFKSSAEYISTPVYKLPQHYGLENIKTVLSGAYFKGLLNSILVVSICMILVILISTSASFAFARLKFRGSNFLFIAVVAALIVPIHSTLIPIYILTVKMHVYNQLAGLIGPYVAFAIPISIFILTSFMRDIPRDFFEAGIIDGASHARVFFKIYLPIARTAVVTVGIFNAVSLWNEFVFAYVLTSSTNKRTLPLTIFDYQGEYSTNIPLMLTALTLSAIPLILTYLIFQERLVNGVMSGAIKS